MSYIMQHRHILVLIFAIVAGLTDMAGQAKKTVTVGGITFNMIKVDGGTFTMGATAEQGKAVDPQEKPPHKVTLSGYYIGEFEVTQKLWKAVMGNNPALFKGDNRPIEMVSWMDCQEFIKKLNALTGLKFRLPTEAEWEYAARGGAKSKGYKFSGSNEAGNVAWCEDNSDKQSHDVGQKQPNELGIYDMCGNVWEFCADAFVPYTEASQTNPQNAKADASTIVSRGGGSGSSAWGCRVSYRSGDTTALRYFGNGFRLALTM